MVVRYRTDPLNPPRLTPPQEACLDALTDADITTAAEADPDNPPLTETELARLEAAAALRRIRAALHLSQSEFAAAYRINLARQRLARVAHCRSPRTRSRPPRPLGAIGKSFLVLFFKKELLLLPYHSRFPKCRKLLRVQTK
jgi:hypothetical protein